MKTFIELQRGKPSIIIRRGLYAGQSNRWSATNIKIKKEFQFDWSNYLKYSQEQMVCYLNCEPNQKRVLVGLELSNGQKSDTILYVLLVLFSNQNKSSISVTA